MLATNCVLKYCLLSLSFFAYSHCKLCHDLWR